MTRLELVTKADPPTPAAAAATTGTAVAIPDIGGRNPWGVRLRGVVPSPGLVAGNYYARYWGTNYSQALVDQQFAEAVRVGANLIKGIGSPWSVIDGSQAQSQYLSRISAWLD